MSDNNNAAIIGVVAIFILVAAVLAFGSPNLTGEAGELPVVKTDRGLATFAAVEGKGQTALKAMVKGSIYETGELMTVFGTCFDGQDQPVVGSYAEFSAWYPNGTQFIFNQSMPAFQDGYFSHQSTMQAVEGTYLTEMVCFANISNTIYTAHAWGEWQNPYWVKRIALLNETLNNLNLSTNVSVNLTPILDSLANLSNLTQATYMLVGNISYFMNDSFEIVYQQFNQTNALINNSYYDLNQSIYYVAQVANSSVDRNDSYLAQLLLNLTAISAPSGSLNFAEEADPVIYMKDWTIEVQAYSPLTGKKIKYPDAGCFITTTISPTPQSMTPRGNEFEFTQKITVLGTFNWAVTCSYA